MMGVIPEISCDPYDYAGYGFSIWPDQGDLIVLNDNAEPGFLQFVRDLANGSICVRPGSIWRTHFGRCDRRAQKLPRKAGCPFRENGRFMASPEKD
jgi:hypothetical protein